MLDTILKFYYDVLQFPLTVFMAFLNSIDGLYTFFITVFFVIVVVRLILRPIFGFAGSDGAANDINALFKENRSNKASSTSTKNGAAKSSNYVVVDKRTGEVLGEK